MAMDGIDDLYKLRRFQPTDVEAVTYFLPHLLAGSPLPHGADMLIRHDEVYAREPKDLAAEYAPVPTAVKTGDRFFFTTCKGTKGKFKRSAGAGTWTINKTVNVYDAGVKVGEARNLSFKKDKVSTGWVMEEYRCLLPQAVVAQGEKVLCKIHLAPTAPAAARQESAAYKLRQERAEPPVSPQPETVTASTQVHKRPAPLVVDADMIRCKKMRMDAADLSSCMKMAVPVPVPVPEPEEEEYEDCPTWPTRAAPVSLPAASTVVPAAAELEEADDDTGLLSCSWEDIFGEQQEEQTLPVEAQINVEHHVVDEDWDDEELQSLLADHDEEEGARLYKGCYYNAAAANLHASSLDGRSQFFSFAAVN